MGGRRRAGRRALAIAALVAIGLLGIAPPAGAATTTTTDAEPLVIAHRGASAVAPEHTFAAYDRAVEDRADVIECDLQMTKDGVLVCMHDTTVDRTTGGTATGRVDSFTLEQLRSMDFGSWFGREFAGASIVPFEEQLRCYAKTGVQFYAETKAPSEYGGRMEPALVQLLDRLHLIPRGPADPSRSKVLVQSFEPRSLQLVKQLAPSLPTAWLWVAPPPESETPRARPEIAAPTASFVLGQPQIVALEHQQGQLVHTWTADDPAQLEQLLDAGVDGIFTNHPDVLRAIVDRRTGNLVRAAVKIRPGCPGVAGTVTAASTHAPVRSGSEPLADAEGHRVEAGSVTETSVDWAAIALALGAFVVVAGIIVWVLARRRAR